MRSLGVVVLGLVFGLIAGVLLTSAVARPMVSDDRDISVGIGLLLGSIMTVMAIAGAVVAVMIDRNYKEKE